MFRYPLLALAALALAGCSGNPFDSHSTADRGRRAAAAAAAQFPSTQPSDDLKATALIDRDKDTIQIVNASDQPVRDATVWVNSSFQRRVSMIPAYGTVVLDRDEFYGPAGNTLSSMKTGAVRVQLQTGDSLYNLQGPVYE